MKAGSPLSAYLMTTIISPSERDAVLLFRAAGPLQLYLNGQSIEEEPVEQQSSLHPLLRQARRSASMRLQRGKNVLVIHTQPPDEERPWWYFGGSLTTVQGAPMLDLEFS